MKENLSNCLMYFAVRYNPKLYWKMRFKLYEPSTTKWMRYYYLFRLKRIESRNCCALGVRLDGGARFETPPFLPHGIKTIFIAPSAKIGKDVVIYQHVGIEIKFPGDKIAPTIGDNVLIGDGAKIIGSVVVGNNAIIGANAVVTKDVPAGCVAVGNPAIIIDRK